MREKEKERERESERERERQKERQRVREKEKERERETKRETDNSFHMFYIVSMKKQCNRIADINMNSKVPHLAHDLPVAPWRPRLSSLISTSTVTETMCPLNAC